MNTQFNSIYRRLYELNEKAEFRGYDPFDGLNSRILQSTPLKNSTFARLAWLQLVKRSPWNLRPFLKVEKGLNSKGVALFALAELSRYRVVEKDVHAENAKHLLNLLSGQKLIVESDGISYGTQIAWGYNFDWQSRAFFAPKNTPTIVPTAFAAFAYIEAYECFKDTDHLEIAESVCRFISENLNRPVETKTEVCFSYTPVDKNVIFNASLLAGEVLGRVGKITKNEHYLELSEKAARFVVNQQKDNGSWAYGPKFRHAWVDNFHTAFILSSLNRIQKNIPSAAEFTEAPLRKGLDYWLDNFFLDDGTPKYFDKNVYPVDIHSAAAAIVGLCDLTERDDRCFDMAQTVAEWVYQNMWDEKGYFYYQVNRFYKTKTPFVRWSSAWMAFALARLIEQESRS